MYWCNGKGVLRCVLCREVVPYRRVLYQRFRCTEGQTLSTSPPACPHIPMSGVSGVGETQHLLHLPTLLATPPHQVHQCQWFVLELTPYPLLHQLLRQSKGQLGCLRPPQLHGIGDAEKLRVVQLKRGKIFRVLSHGGRKEQLLQGGGRGAQFWWNRGRYLDNHTMGTMIFTTVLLYYVCGLILSNYSFKVRVLLSSA